MWVRKHVFFLFALACRIVPGTMTSWLALADDRERNYLLLETDLKFFDTLTFRVDAPDLLNRLQSIVNQEQLEPGYF